MDAKPAVGIRLTARPVEVPEDKSATSLVSLAATDSEGRYRLDDIPPGRYAISAGWIAIPTYYPGTLQFEDAMQLTITSGSTISGIDFTLLDTGVEIPIKLTIEGGDGTLPTKSEIGRVRLRLIEEESGRSILESSLDVRSITMPPNPGLYLAVVENMPAGYLVEAITHASMPQSKSAIRISAANLPQPSNPARPAQAVSELTITLVPATTAR